MQGAAIGITALLTARVGAQQAL